jgi:hypothetical protein
VGSLNTDGSAKLQPNIVCALRHHGNFLVKSNTEDDLRGNDIANSGTIRTDFDSKGVVWQPGGTVATSGLPANARNADNSIERAKHTANGQEAGNLQGYATRAIDGIHVSVSDRQAIVDPVMAGYSGLIGGDTNGPMETITERKMFFLDHDRAHDGQPATLSAWTIFDSAGDAVGADDGTTDVDTTPNEGLPSK